MKNSPGPLYCKIAYGDGIHQHTMELPLAFQTGDIVPSIGVPVSVTPAAPYTGQSLSYSVWSAALVAALKTALSHSQSVSSIEVWYMETATAKPKWIYSAPVASGTGTLEGAPVIANVMTLSFRTNRGGRFRSCLCDHVDGPDRTATYADIETGGFTELKAWMDYLLSENGVVVGRDGGRLVSMVRAISKENDALRRRKMR